MNDIKFWCSSAASHFKPKLPIKLRNKNKLGNSDSISYFELDQDPRGEGGMWRDVWRVREEPAAVDSLLCKRSVSVNQQLSAFSAP